MDRMEHVRALRASTDRHYNCCQSILVPFAEEMGLTEEAAYALGANFGAGMKHGSTCGTLTGALMVLGGGGPRGGGGRRTAAPVSGGPRRPHLRRAAEGLPRAGGAPEGPL